MKATELKFRPTGMGWWVDPRICSVRAENLRSYLLAHGWHLRSQPRPELLFFENEQNHNGDILSFPASENASDYLQRIIEVLTVLAAQAQRYAVEILDEVLLLEEEPNKKEDGRTRATSATRAGFSAS
jgi:hypothetical protein